MEENKDSIDEKIIDENVIDEAVETQEAEMQEAVEPTAEDLIAVAKKEAAENLDRYQRCFAEFDNFRKRTIKEKAGMYDRGVQSVAEKLLPVIDNLERAVAAQKDAAEDAFYTGVSMILKQLQEVLFDLGVEVIPAVGEAFDPNLHQAVGHEENEAYGENEVILELQKGYRFQDKVIRPSMVHVAN